MQPLMDFCNSKTDRKKTQQNKQGNYLNTRSNVKLFPKYSEKCREICNRKSSTLKTT